MAYSDLQTRAFTQIAYMELDKAYKDYCIEHNTKKVPLSELLKEGSAERKKLNDLGISNEEINSWSLTGVHDTNADNGFYACIIETEPGKAAVGFRGSESMSDLGNVQNDWVGADLGLVNSTCTNQHEETDIFLSKYKNVLGEYSELAMTGHSLGGNLAEYATIVSGKYGLDDNIAQCVSMDGPGFSNEFIKMYGDEISKMSDIMYHPRWSFVGTMLNDLPGVRYQYVQVANESNKVDDAQYNSLTRHDTKYLVYDKDGNLVSGEQDRLSKITSVISEGIDHLPSNIGDAFITVIGSAWIGITWVTEKMFDEEGNITHAGRLIIAGAIEAIKSIGVGTVAVALLKVVVAVLAVLVAAYVFELVYDVVMTVVDAICEVAGEVVSWIQEKYQEFKEGVKALINKAKNWLKDKFNAGYQYANAHPQITVDTYKLRNYAQRIQDVNRRVSYLDSRLDSLYWKVGLTGLWNLMQADLLTGYSWRLNRCISYLNETASDFDDVEVNLINGL